MPVEDEVEGEEATESSTRPAERTPDTDTEPAPDAADAPADGAGTDDADATDDTDDDPGDLRPAMTPRQARRVRTLVSGVVMAAVTVALVVRVESGPSLLVLAFYGIALILSGNAVALSRRGRTRVATAVLAAGFLVVVAAEWLLAA